jgi:hypothetical protein
LILRAALQDSVPREILNRRKTGFPVPYGRWLRGKGIRDFLFDTLLDHNTDLDTYFFRDIIQQEAEWSNGVPDSPNVYSQMYFTLPANATYYTYALRAIFVNSLQSRTLTDLCAIRLSVSSGQPVVLAARFLEISLFGTRRVGQRHRYLEPISRFTSKLQLPL